MTEVLNQEQENITVDADATDDEDLFADYFDSNDSEIPSDESEENDQNLNEEDNSSETVKDDLQDAGTHDQPVFMTVKFNKEEKGLTQEEAITYAQKGMNYDKVYGELEQLKAQAPILSEVSRLAKANGMSETEYLKQLSEIQEAWLLNTEVEKLQKQYPNSDPELLQELARKNIADHSNEVSKKEEHVDNRKQDISSQLEKFEKRYPEEYKKIVSDPKSIDPKIAPLMAQGYTFLEAYEEIEAEKRAIAEKERASRDKINKINAENKAKSLGNTSNRGYQEEDEFIKELFSD